MIFAIDPGCTQSAYVIWDGERIRHYAILPNPNLLDTIRYRLPPDTNMAIERISSYGMAVGDEIFETVHWSGRFYEAWLAAIPYRGAPIRITRHTIKIHHCHSSKAKDTNIRQVMIDKYGPPGKKKSPGVTFGLHHDLWAAFALATYITETADEALRELQRAP